MKANKVKKYYPKSKIIFTKEHGKDSRSYVVNFNKILTSNDVVFYKDNKPKPIKQLKYLYQP